ncbi:hypothetical protein K458DRAFT_197029 [Lentithecium fluviatile CBS 122367]|uniref:Iron reductase domain protein n=1 Tax=Lentithecium fluviatile CBS 122367 TaxID=1168545 RepID=A0A6G1ICV8_9PLEO|nr:hypothetical protein K458DRAFT_197029 [Lentithecium fluviatile CBS 122367]
MSGALVWVVYRNGDEKGVTLSPRISTGHVEPTHNADIPCELNDQDGNTPGGIIEHNGHKIIAVNVRCRDVNHRASFGSQSLDASAKLDFNNEAQPFIFAVGPTDRHLLSDSKSAGIRRHSLYGSFTLDIRAASVNTSHDINQPALSSVGSWAPKNAKLVVEPHKDLDWSGPIHSLLMCGTFVVVFPMGVVFLRVLEKVRWHAYMQGVGTVLVAGGVGMGVYAGREYNQVSIPLLPPPSNLTNPFNRNRNPNTPAVSHPPLPAPNPRPNPLHPRPPPTLRRPRTPPPLPPPPGPHPARPRPRPPRPTASPRRRAERLPRLPLLGRLVPQRHVWRHRGRGVCCAGRVAGLECA